MVRKVRLLLWILVALALAGFAALLLLPPREARDETQVITSTSYGGPFTLTGADGQAFSSSRLAGKPYAVFFGFTHCPDVCPTTLARLVRLRQQIGGERPFEILFVTVDPERDGPAEVGKYSQLFDSPVMGLTGSPAEIEQVKRQFGIYSRKVPGHHGSEYSVDHTTSVLLFDRNGGFTGTISPEEPDPPAAAKLKRISA
jgi:protein SCO1/2